MQNLYLSTRLHRLAMLISNGRTSLPENDAPRGFNSFMIAVNTPGVPNALVRMAGCAFDSPNFGAITNEIRDEFMALADKLQAGLPVENSDGSAYYDFSYAFPPALDDLKSRLDDMSPTSRGLVITNLSSDVVSGLISTSPNLALVYTSTSSGIVVNAGNVTGVVTDGAGVTETLTFDYTNAPYRSYGYLNSALAGLGAGSTAQPPTVTVLGLSSLSGATVPDNVVVTTNTDGSIICSLQVATEDAIDTTLAETDTVVPLASVDLTTSTAQSDLTVGLANLNNGDITALTIIGATGIAQLGLDPALYAEAIDPDTNTITVTLQPNPTALPVLEPVLNPAALGTEPIESFDFRQTSTPDFTSLLQFVGQIGAPGSVLTSITVIGVSDASAIGLPDSVITIPNDDGSFTITAAPQALEQVAEVQPTTGDIAEIDMSTATAEQMQAAFATLYAGETPSITLVNEASWSQVAALLGADLLPGTTITPDADVAGKSVITYTPAISDGNPTVSADGTTIAYDFGDAGMITIEKFEVDLAALAAGTLPVGVTAVSMTITPDDDVLELEGVETKMAFVVPANIQVDQSGDTAIYTVKPVADQAITQTVDPSAAPQLADVGNVEQDGQPVALASDLQPAQPQAGDAAAPAGEVQPTAAPAAEEQEQNQDLQPATPAGGNDPTEAAVGLAPHVDIVQQ